MKSFIVLAVIVALAIGQSSIYDQYYAEALKIAQGMTIDQKIGQTFTVDF